MSRYRGVERGGGAGACTGSHIRLIGNTCVHGQATNHRPRYNGESLSQSTPINI